MKGALYIGSVRKIRMYIHWTFILLLIYAFTMTFLRSNTFSTAILLVLLILAVFFTVFMHELGHALVAGMYGCSTKDIVLLPIGGMARMEKMPQNPIGEVLTALAGPLVNLLIAGAVLLIFNLRIDSFSDLNLSGLNARNWLHHFMYANIIVALFNLIPAFPMDGGRIFRGLLAFRLPKVKATLIAARVGQVLALGMIVVGIFSNPVLVLIGVFVALAAQMETRNTADQSILQDAVVSDVMIHHIETVQATSTLRHAVRHLLDSQATVFLVLKEGRPVGHVSRQSLLDAIAKNGQDVFIETCMSHDLIYVKAVDPLDGVFSKMQSSSGSIALVTSGNGIHGFLEMENIMEFIAYRRALKLNLSHMSTIG
jgi:Zn-dependent protease